MINRKEYLRQYYQSHKEHLSKINIESNRRFKKKNPWIESFYKIGQRCNNPRCKNYPRYGGRGIKSSITKEEIKVLWFRDKAFNMNYPTIDRKDNDGNYEFSNCQFLENSINSKTGSKLSSLHI